jgi:hypothetical protein
MPDTSTPRPRHYLLVGAALIGLFAAVSLARLIDGDEGFYLVAARLVTEGKRPYGDFFYLQMPILPYALAGWMSLVGAGWYAARILSAILAASVGLLVFHASVRSTRSLPLALLATLLFAACGLSLGWFSPVKTYGLSELLLLSAYLCAGSDRRASLLASGLCIGLATSVRLYLIVAAPCVALHLLRRSGRIRDSLAPLACVAAGTLLGLLPCLPFLLRDREAFVFDTFTFHSMRYPEGGEGLVGAFGPKLATVLSLLGLRESEGTGGIQFLALLAAGLIALPGRKNSLAASFWIVLGATSLLPNPTFNQYFCLIVPFLAIGIAERLGASMPLAPWASRAAVLALLLYVVLGALDARRFVATGVRVPGIEEPRNAVNWSIPTVQEIGRGIDEVGTDLGASWWPGYFAFTRTRIVTEMANDFSIRAAPRLTAEQRARFHIPSYEDIGRMIETGSPRLFVEGNWSPSRLGTILPQYGYRMREQVARTRIWERPLPGR